MTTFKRYLCYSLEKSVLRVVILTVLSLFMTLSVVSGCIENVETVQYNETGIFMLATVLGILCTVIPVLETSGFKNRRNLDTLYFFPIKRWKMALVHYINGFVQVFAAYSVTFFATFGYLLANTDYFALHHMVGYYFLSVLVGLVMYSFFMFVFGQGNTVADGAVFIALWIAAISVASLAIVRVTTYAGLTGNGRINPFEKLLSWGTAYTPINNLTVIFQDLIEINRDGMYHARSAARYRSEWYMFVFWGAIGVASVFGYFVTFIKKGAQKAGEISDSPFGYKLLIPLYGYSFLLLIGGIYIIAVPVLVAMTVGYIIYRRGFKFTPYDICLLAGGMGAMMLGAIMNS